MTSAPTRPLRLKLIANGVITPRQATLTPLPRGNRGRVLRIDDAGRLEAERACRDRSIVYTMEDQLEVMQRRPLFGARPSK